MVGSAQCLEDKVVPLAFFNVDEPEKSGPLAGPRSRRGRGTV